MPPTTLFGLGYGTGPAGYGYPPGARRPSISYPDSPFTWYDHVEITASLPTNGGGPITNYSVLSGSLPTGVSLNATTGELTGTPTTQQSAASVVIRARGPGGVSDTTISVEVLAMPLSLGSSLAAWYKADAGCYTDAACLFASASSQYLSKSSPTFAPTTKMTIAFDWKPTTVGATQDLAAREFGVSQNQFIVRQQASGLLQVFIAASVTDGGGNFAEGSTTLVAGVQYRIVVVYDGTLSAANRIAVYVNGVAESLTLTGTIPATLTTSTSKLLIGDAALSSSADGAMARLGLSSQALSGAALTAAHTSTFWADMTAARQADWFSFYNLCEASSTRVDSTGLNDLTPTNGPTVAAGPGEGLCVDNSPCKRIEDQSGNARHLEQATIAAQPIWTAAFQNGLPALVFDDVNDYVTCAGFTFSQPCAYGVACGSTATGYMIDADSPQSGRVFENQGATTLRMYAPATVFDSTVSALATFRSYVALYNGASSVLSQDGVETTGTVGAGNGTGVRIGAAGDAAVAFSQLNLGELVLAAGAMTASGRASLHGYQKNRWSTP